MQTQFQELRGRFMPFLTAGLITALSTCGAAFAQQPASRTPAGVRDCALVTQTGRKHRTKSGKGTAGSDTTPAACTELKQNTLLTQEYLQKYVREHNWNVDDEEISEDTWTFSVLLGKDELGAYTKTSPELKVAWKSGKAVVNVRTTELPDGFTRLTISAEFDGFGEPEDEFAQKRDSWPLPSNGVLEASLISAVKNHPF